MGDDDSGSWRCRLGGAGRVTVMAGLRNPSPKRKRVGICPSDARSKKHPRACAWGSDQAPCRQNRHTRGDAPWMRGVMCRSELSRRSPRGCRTDRLDGFGLLEFARAGRFLGWVERYVGRSCRHGPGRVEGPPASHNHSLANITAGRCQVAS